MSLQVGPHSGSYRRRSPALKTANVPERRINATFTQRTGASVHSFRWIAAGWFHRSRHTALALRRLEIPLTFKTVLIAVAAAVALMGAALIAVPSAQEGLQLCLDLPRCLGF